MKVLPRTTFSFVYIVVLTCLTCDVLGQNQKSKIVTTVLNTKWSHTPLVLEAAEFLAEENGEYFWDFLDFLSDKQSIDLKRLSAQEIYENVISFASRYELSELTFNEIDFKVHKGRCYPSETIDG